MTEPTRYTSLLTKFSLLTQMEDLFRVEIPTPRVIFPIGISGSGKSSGLATALKKSWTLINADETRRTHLRTLASMNRKIALNGLMKIPDADSATDVFAPELRKILPAWILSDFEIALQKKCNIVLDITNLTLERVRYLLQARKAQYHCEAVLFPSLDLHINASRVKDRGERGGLDIADPTAPDAWEKRMQILRNLDANFWGFLESLGVGESSSPLPSAQELDGFDFGLMKNHSGNLQSFIDRQNPQDQKLLKTLADHDRFDRVYVIPAPSRLTSGEVPK